jgi:hypothetical protein
MLKNNSKLLLFLLLFSAVFALLIGYFLFNSTFFEPDYYVCTTIGPIDIELLNNNYSFNYPKSCDQAEYFKGFENFNTILLTEHSYQQRPLYIAMVYLANLLFTPIFLLLKISQTLGLLISLTFIHLIILNLALFFILKVVNPQNLNIGDLGLLVIFNLLTPIAKWGIFEPSNQMFTLLLMILPVYFYKLNKELYYPYSFIFGILFLANRVSLIGMIIYLLLVILSSHKLRFFDVVKQIIAFFIPFLGYRLFFTVRGLTIFDTNTETYQQFSWIIDYFTGGNRKYGEYFCHRIPGFIKCYAEGTSDLLMYLLIPSIFAILYILMSIRLKNTPRELFLSFTVLYFFWSLIGWYPMRFIYYSLGNFINILIIFGYFNLNKNFLQKLLYSFPIIFYYLYLTMWNNPDPDNFIDRNYLFISLMLTFIYLVNLLMERIRQN